MTSLETIAKTLFLEEPKPRRSICLVPDELSQSSDYELLFEMLITLLMEGIRLQLETLPGDITSLTDPQILSYLQDFNLWFESVGYQLEVNSTNYSSEVEIFHYYSQRYCKTILDFNNMSQFYRFLLNPTKVNRTKLEDYYMIGIINNICYQFSFRPI